MRETVYVLIGKDHAGQELQRLMDQDQMGPLEYWALSQLLSMAGHPATRVLSLGTVSCIWIKIII